MALVRFQELMRRQVNAGMRKTDDISLVSRAEISKAAGDAFEEVLAEARGKPVDSPAVRTLRLVSRLVIGKWDDAE